MRHPSIEQSWRDVSATHIRRATPFDLERSIEEAKGYAGLFAEVGPASGIMWGPNDYVCTGNLRNWDVSERLAEVHAPTLVIGGMYDQLGPNSLISLANGICQSEFVVFGHSGHLTFLERDVDSYLAVIRDFVRRHSTLGAEGDGPF